MLDNGTICDIEIQLVDKGNMVERFLGYWARLYSSQLRKGEDYKRLNKVIGIIIIDFKFEKTKEIERINTKWKIKEVLTGKDIELTDGLELHIIELPKVTKALEKNRGNKLVQWMAFLNNPEGKEIREIMIDNKEIKRAMDELERITSDEELMRIIELKEKAERDLANAKSYRNGITDWKNGRKKRYERAV